MAIEIITIRQLKEKENHLHVLVKRDWLFGIQNEAWYWLDTEQTNALGLDTSNINSIENKAKLVGYFQEYETFCKSYLTARVSAIPSLFLPCCVAEGCCAWPLPNYMRFKKLSQSRTLNLYDSSQATTLILEEPISQTQRPSLLTMK